MEKNSVKRLTKRRLRVLYRLCALVCALTVALAVPGVAGASSDDLPSIESLGLYYFSSTTKPGNPNGNYLGGQTQSNGKVSGSFMQAYANTTDFYVGVYLNCIMAEDVPRGTTFDVSTTFGYSFTGEDGSSYGILPYEVNVIGYSSIWNQTVSSKTLSRSGASTSTSHRYYNYANVCQGPTRYLRLYVKFYIPANTDTSGSTGSAYLSVADMGINLDSVVINYSNELTGISGKIDLLSGELIDLKDAINDGFDSVGDQIGDVQQDMNSGFGQIGDQIGDVQQDINTGFGNVSDAINGSGADTSGMDSGLSNLGGQLGDLGAVEDQLGGAILDKVEVPDLILTQDQGAALALLVSCLNLAYVDLSGVQVLFAAVLFFGIIGVLLFGRRNL